MEVVAELVHHDPVPDLQGRLHRTRRDGVGGDDEGAQEDGDDDGHDDDAEQLDDPAVRPSLGSASWRPSARRRGRRVGPLVVGVHGPRSITRSGAARPVGRGITRRCHAPGTGWDRGQRRHLRLLRHPRPLGRRRCATTTKRSSPPTATRSTRPSSRTTSPATTGSTMPSTRSARRPTRPGSGRACGDLTDGLRGGRAARSRAVIDALRDVRPGRDGRLPRGGGDAVRHCARRASPSASAPTGDGSSTPSSARSACLHLVDAGVTSARAGARKPHPGIYAQAAESLGVDPRRGPLRR